MCVCVWGGGGGGGGGGGVHSVRGVQSVHGRVQADVDMDGEQEHIAASSHNTITQANTAGHMPTSSER